MIMFVVHTHKHVCARCKNTNTYTRERHTTAHVKRVVGKTVLLNIHVGQEQSARRRRRRRRRPHRRRRRRDACVDDADKRIFATQT